MSSLFLGRKFLSRPSAPRFASLVQSNEVQRLVGSRDGAICHITRPVSLCIAPGFYPAATCAREPSSPSPGLPRPVDHSTHPYRACDSACPDTSGATRLWGGAVRPRSRLWSWGRELRVAVTFQGPALPVIDSSVIGRYVPREDEPSDRAPTGEMPPSPSWWPLSVLDLSRLRHHPRLLIPHARPWTCCQCTLTLLARYLLLLYPPCPFLLCSSPCLHPMATPLCLGGAL